MSKEKVAYKGIGLGGMIFIVFLALKLAGIGEVATWSWWWVTSPLWIPWVLVIAVLVFVGLLAFVISLLD
jgi:hypothetical protein